MRTLFCVPFFLLSTVPTGVSKTLEFYFVDVELGTATLIVSPSGESMLIDTGSSGNNDRDANRVFAAAKQAGLRKIDYLVVTHFQDDHYGVTSELANKIPILNFVDHGSSVEFGKDAAWHKRWMIGNQDELWVAYSKAREKGRHLVAKPGDKIPIKGMDALVLTSAGEKLAGPLKGAGGPNRACSNVEPKSPDEIGDGQSVGVLITFGKFRFIHLGDLTWNKAKELFCPNNLVGTVDVYEATHHAVRADKNAAPVLRGRDCCSEAEVCTVCVPW